METPITSLLPTSLNSTTDISSGVVQPNVGDTPFEMLFAEAENTLDSLSAQEEKVNSLIGDYLQGKGDLEDVIFALNRQSGMVNLAVSVISNSTQAFKEIQQMPI